MSDLDVLVKSNFYESILSELKAEFDSSSLSYIANFTDYNSIAPHFYELIKQDLVRLK